MLDLLQRIPLSGSIELSVLKLPKGTVHAPQTHIKIIFIRKQRFCSIWLAELDIRIKAGENHFLLRLLVSQACHH